MNLSPLVDWLAGLLSVCLCVCVFVPFNSMAFDSIGFILHIDWFLLLHHHLHQCFYVLILDSIFPIRFQFRISWFCMFILVYVERQTATATATSTFSYCLVHILDQNIFHRIPILRNKLKLMFEFSSFTLLLLIIIYNRHIVHRN